MLQATYDTGGINLLSGWQRVAWVAMLHHMIQKRVEAVERNSMQALKVERLEQLSNILYFAHGLRRLHREKMLHVGGVPKRYPCHSEDLQASFL